MTQPKKLDEPTWIYPFAAMKIGDSFFVPTTKPAPQHYVIDTMAKDAGIKVRTFTTTHEGFLGVRAWRIG